MKTAEWKRIVRPLLPVVEEWGFRGRLCYRSPVHRVALGVLAEGSGFHTGIYIWRTAIPLYVPWHAMDLTWSSRIGGGSRFYDVTERGAIEAAIRSVVEWPGAEEDAIARFATRDVAREANSSEREMVGYARLLRGEAAGARAVLAAVDDRAADDDPPWKQQVTERVRLISRLLDEGKHKQAVEQLDRWSEHTATALGLRYARLR